jgi:peroxiredoxin
MSAAMYDPTSLPEGLPRPVDDGAAAHLVGADLPDIGLRATTGPDIFLARLVGRTVLYAYPRTGRPGQEPAPGWDLVPGARGCTPQSCAFRDHYADLRELGASHVFGLSTQDTSYQREMAERLHLPFPVLSDESLSLARALQLPTFEIQWQTLLKRLAMIIDGGRITHVFYPVFPPDRNAEEVLAWMRGHPVDA